MHRMHHLAARLAFGLTLAASDAREAPAALIRPTDTSTFPNISARSVGGTPRSGASSRPFAIQETPDIPTLVRSEPLIAQLNGDGPVQPNGSSLDPLHVRESIDGKVVGGFSFQDGPTSLDLSNPSTSAHGPALLDFDVRPTGGRFARPFGPDALVRVEAERWGSIQGGFAGDSGGGAVATEVRSGHPISPSFAPSPVPEPSTLVVLIACGGVGLVVRRRRRVGLDELESGILRTPTPHRQSARKVAESLPSASFSI